MFDYLEVFCNRQSGDTAIGSIPPVTYGDRRLTVADVLRPVVLTSRDV